MVATVDYKLFVLLIFVFTSAIDLFALPLTSTQETEYKNRPKGFGSAKYAVLIGVDGLGGNFLKDVVRENPTILSFFTKGAHSLRARTTIPTVSGTAWTTILSGLDLSQHGVYYNNWTEVTDGNPVGNRYGLTPSTGRGFPQTIYNVIKKHSNTMKTGLFFTWEWFKHVLKANPGIDFSHFGGDTVTCRYYEAKSQCINRQDWATQQAAIRAITEEKLKFSFIHLDAVDAAGHGGWFGSYSYQRMIYQIDVQIGGIIRALRNVRMESGKTMLDETMVMIVSDHGGDGSSHASLPLMRQKMNVPVLIRGPGIKNVDLDKPFLFSDITMVDISATILNALGIEKTKFMRGRVLEEIY